jgi:hypothetical protein
MPHKQKKRYTGPLRLPQQTIPLSRTPFSTVVGDANEADYTASANLGNVIWYAEMVGRPPTQRERDVLDLLFEIGEPIQMDGTIGYRFEAYRFLRRLGYKHPGERDVMWLRDKLRRWIRPMSISATDGSAWHDFAIVSDAHAKRIGDERAVRWMVAVVLSPAYVQMLRSTIHLSYHGLVAQIIALPNDLAKGIARTMLGYANRHRRLDDMLRDLGVDPTKLAARTRGKYRAAVIAATADLAGIGIVVGETGRGLAGVMLHMTRQPDGVYTPSPAKSPIADLLGFAGDTRLA